MAAKLYSPLGVEMARASEAQDTIAAWAIATFGQPVSVHILAERANKEMLKLLRATNLAARPGAIETPVEAKEFAVEIAGECADVLIVLYQIAEQCGIDLHGAVDQKMNINRSRKWSVAGNGTGQHSSLDGAATGSQPDRSHTRPAPSCSIGEGACPVPRHGGDTPPDTRSMENLPSHYKPLRYTRSGDDPWQPKTVDRSSLFEPSLSYQRERMQR